MNWRRKKEKEEDLERELNSDLELEAEEQREAGLPAGEARYAAQRALGNATLLKEEVRKTWRWTWLDGLLGDFRYGIRQFRRHPGFSALIIATLALGIGGNVAIFSVLRAVVLRSLPYEEPDKLVALWQKDTGRGQRDKVTAADYLDWKARNHVFEDMAYSWDAGYTLTGSGDSQSLIAYQFSPNFFSLLGTRPLVGRTFLSEDGEPGHDHVAVLSYRFWQSKFGANSNVVGSAIRLDGDPYTVVGVMPDAFAHPGRNVDLWTPLQFPAGLSQNRGLHVFQTFARLKPRVTIAQAQSEMNALARQIAHEHPDTNLHTSAELEPIRDTYAGNLRPALWVLQAAVFFMLLVACGNVANMLLARASADEREVAVRLALGAGRWRLLRQYVIQGLILSGCGAGLGTGLAVEGVRVLPQLFQDRLANLALPDHAAAWMDWPVLSFALAIAVLSGLTFGTIPALRRITPSQEVLKAGGRGSMQRSSAVRLRHVLIVGQVALSLLLLVGSGLLIRSFLRLQEQSLGFQTDHVVTFVLTPAPNRYSGLAKTSAFLQQILTRIRALPGVQSAASISTLPLSGMDARRPYLNPGEPVANDRQQVVQYRVTTPDYFRAMHIPLRNGRFFNDGDRQGSREVVIINEKLARRLWPNADPIGMTLNVADLAKPEAREIVGVVGDVRHGGMASEPPIEVYRPADQASWPFFGVVVRTSVEPTHLVRSIREAVWSVDKNQPVDDVRTMEDRAAGSVALHRASMLLMGVFAGLALLLASLGIYSVISYSVTLRTHEIGVRMALGARTSEILMMVLGQSACLALIGIALGLIAALALTRYLATLLFGITATDAVTIVVAMITMTVVAVGAAYFPARRASRVDLMVALRYE